jgi:hypothetical protein
MALNNRIKFGMQQTKDKDGRLKWRPIICVQSQSRDIEFLGDVLLENEAQAKAFVKVLAEILAHESPKSSIII